MPVKVIVDTETKTFEITIGTPPVSQLIAKEVSAEKGSGVPNKDKIGNLAIEQVIKIAKMKRDSMLANNLKSAVKNVIGSANSMGVLVENKKSVDVNVDVNAGLYDDLISNEQTEASQEKLNNLNSHLKRVQNVYKIELEKAKAEQEAAAAVAAETAAAKPEEAKKEEATADKATDAKSAPAGKTADAKAAPSAKAATGKPAGKDKK